MAYKAGIVLLDEKTNEILLGHPTNSSWKNWTIPKGEIDDGELITTCAVREFKEETGIELESTNSWEFLGAFTYKKSRNTLFVLLLRGDWKDKYPAKDLKCKSTFTNRKTGKVQPEIDSFKWEPYESAINQVHEAQQRALKLIPDINEPEAYL